MKSKKTLLAILSLVLFTTLGFADVIVESVPIKLGAKAFKDGDVIQILDVRSTSKNMEQGDTVTVTGKYRLDSAENAQLLLLLTQVEGDGSEETEKSQKIDAKSGWHSFETTITIKHRGILHLTFYDKQTGKPFGGVYFGTEKQVENANDISVSHYLVKS